MLSYVGVGSLKIAIRERQFNLFKWKKLKRGYFSLYISVAELYHDLKDEKINNLTAVFCKKFCNSLKNNYLIFMVKKKFDFCFV